MRNFLFCLCLGGALSGATLKASEDYVYYQDYENTCCPQEVCCSGRFSLGADWLYWKTEETGMNYGASVTFSGDDTAGRIAAEILKPDFEYRSGYRIFGDYTTCDDVWRFYAAYSHVPSHAGNMFDSTMSMTSLNFASIFNANFPIFTVLAETDFNSLDSTLDISVNYFDFDVSRNFFPCECLKIIPHLGIRALWTNQTFRLTGVAIDVLSFTSRLRSKTTNVGLEGGIGAEWYLLKGFSIIGNVGGSILYSHFHNKGDLDVLTSTGSIDVSYRDRFHTGLAMFDAFIGLQYQTCIGSRFGVNIHAGWEEHLIFDINPFSLGAGGNLNFQGLTLGGSISF